MRKFVCDFETTVYEGQTRTDVWAAAICEIGWEDVEVFNSIEKFWDYVCGIGENVILYFHNLKFDSSFLLDYLIRVKKYKNALSKNEKQEIEFTRSKNMLNKTIRYNLSASGLFYQMIVKDKFTIDIRDSYKLLPFSVEEIGESFKTKHRKTKIEYEGVRFPNGKITDEEKEYIKNDVLVLSEALYEFVEMNGNNKLTIGACCKSKFKQGYKHVELEYYFPSLQYPCPVDGFNSVDEYIRKSYRGGWCYLKRGEENKEQGKGFTIDVNSLYPYVMLSESGNAYPYGKPKFWQGDYIPLLDSEKTYYFVRFQAEFDIKRGMLPFVQVKNNLMYESNVNLETSAIKNPFTGKYENKYIDMDGNEKRAVIELTMSQTDFELFQEHYFIHEIKILDGCYFRTQKGFFDDYLNEFKKIKMRETGAKREIAKLFSNNLYGQFGANSISDFKIAKLRSDNVITFRTQQANEKEAGYIPIACAITSYARKKTIEAAQANYNIFIYSDTDSLHCKGDISELKNVEIDSKEYGKFAIESVWDKAIFIRQKTYIEHITGKEENGKIKKIKPYYNIICAGLQKRCKELLNMSLTGEYKAEELTEQELEFVKEKRKLTDFKAGLKIPGKLEAKRIVGGIVLEKGFFTLKK